MRKALNSVAALVIGALMVAGCSKAVDGRADANKATGSGASAVKAAEAAFKNAELVRWSELDPPGALEVGIAGPPAVPTISMDSNGRSTIYPPMERTALVSAAQHRMDEYMNSDLTVGPTQALQEFMKDNFGYTMDLVGGEGAQVTRFDSAAARNGTATLVATIEPWIWVGHLNVNGIKALLSTNGVNFTPSAGQVTWELLRGQDVVKATMKLVESGTWALESLS